MHLITMQLKTANRPSDWDDVRIAGYFNLSETELMIRQFVAELPQSAMSRIQFTTDAVPGFKVYLWPTYADRPQQHIHNLNELLHTLGLEQMDRDELKRRGYA